MTAVQLPIDPVLYEIYVRSFADSNGDGIGDLNGIISRLGHFVNLGIDGIWLTPIFTSPQFDYGYDVSDYYTIHHEFGTLSDLDELILQAHQRGIAVILDMVLGHTSHEHPWFQMCPERYHFADNIPNNWLSRFGGSAWALHTETGRYYYHRYYREQPNLNWNNPDVRRAMHDVIRFWVERGVDGFRLDALDGIAIDPQLRDEPYIGTAGMTGREDGSWSEYWTLDHIYTSNLPQVIDELRRLRDAFPQVSFLVEADLPNTQLHAYTAVVDSAFSFEFFRAPLNGLSLARIDPAGHDGSMAWALSNHDHPRMVSRWGRSTARNAAMLLLTLPGWSFIYQGDEIGMIDGPGGSVAYDRYGRDKVRHPMQWDPSGGFTTGDPWLPMIDPAECNVADQRSVSDSMLELYRKLIQLRRSLKGPVTLVDAETDRLIFQRNSHHVTLNLGNESLALPNSDEVIFSTTLLDERNVLPPHSGAITRI